MQKSWLGGAKTEIWNFKINQETTMMEEVSFYSITSSFITIPNTATPQLASGPSQTAAVPSRAMA